MIWPFERPGKPPVRLTREPISGWISQTMRDLRGLSNRKEMLDRLQRAGVSPEFRTKYLTNHVRTLFELRTQLVEGKLLPNDASPRDVKAMHMLAQVLLGFEEAIVRMRVSAGAMALLRQFVLESGAFSDVRERDIAKTHLPRIYEGLLASRTNAEQCRNLLSTLSPEQIAGTRDARRQYDALIRALRATSKRAIGNEYDLQRALADHIDVFLSRHDVAWDDVYKGALDVLDAVNAEDRESPDVVPATLARFEAFLKDMSLADRRALAETLMETRVDNGIGSVAAVEERAVLRLDEDLLKQTDAILRRGR